ncbi:MAG TPA: aminodeoxychorismate lyase, partial [Rhodospirillales bacterium]|nr:aminodeoxychorismate lyase [Rhodospirillales bacterium]
MIPRVIIGLAAVALILVIAFAWAVNAFNRPGPLTAETTVVIEPGDGLAGVTQRLADAGVISDPLLFRLGVQVLGDARGLRAGEYAFGPGASM